MNPALRGCSVRRRDSGLTSFRISNTRAEIVRESIGNTVSRITCGIAAPRRSARLSKVKNRTGGGGVEKG